MPTFFIDTNVDGHMLLDDEGAEYVDAEAAVKDCIQGWLDLAKSQLRADTKREFMAVIRNTEGEIVSSRALAIAVTVS